MPFTLSHAAAVLPAGKKLQTYLPLSALLMGSFSPDFRYFFPDDETRSFSHSLEGLVLFCLPISLFALLVFHYLVKEPMVQLLPESVQQRLDAQTLQFTFRPLRQLGFICLAIILGAFTHIVWDSFTHQYGWSVERWEFFRQTVIRLSTYEVKLFKILQHLSSIFGLAFVAYRFMQWYRKQPVQNSSVKPLLQEADKRRILLGVISLATVYGFVRGLWVATHYKNFRAIQEFTAQTVVGLMIGTTILVLLYSLFYKSIIANLNKKTLEEDGLE